nr:hypothetical protein [Tanacetum cinerariifolium]
MKRKVDNKDRDVRQTQNSKYSESLETLPIKKKVGHLKKSVKANENKSSSVKRRGRPRKSNEEKKQTIGSKGMRMVEDANVANPSEAANVAQASPIAQGSRAAILHASPIRMTKKAAKRTDINKSSAEYTEDNSNDEDNEDSHSAEEEQNDEDSDSVKTPPVKKRGRPKKIVRANENKSKGREYKVDDDDDNDGTKKMKKKSKIYDENNKNSKIRIRTTPTTLFNAMAILNGDRKKCLHEMVFGSMIGMGIHELPRKLEYLWVDVH